MLNMILENGKLVAKNTKFVFPVVLFSKSNTFQEIIKDFEGLIDKIFQVAKDYNPVLLDFNIDNNIDDHEFILTASLEVVATNNNVDDMFKLFDEIININSKQISVYSITVG
jgi:hypothetical protein